MDRADPARDGGGRADLRGARRARGDRATGPIAIGLPEGGGRISFEGVTFGYEPAQPVLEDIDLEIDPGSVVALIGHTGSGKTTLTALLPALLRPAARPGADRRRRRARRPADRPPPLDRRRLAGSVPLLDDRPREHRVRRRRSDGRRGRAGSPHGAGARVRRAAPGRLRDRHRRARHHALGRPAPADRDRPRAPRSIRACSSSTTPPPRSTRRPRRESASPCKR